jgi:adenylate kinase family enzyme
MRKNDRSLKENLSQTYIIGGSPCSGKSTIAEKLANEYQFRYYRVDDYYQAHVKRCNPNDHPTMYKIANMSWNEIWSRSVPIQVNDEFTFYRELFGMILDDLAVYQPGEAIILEGAALLPELIEKSIIDARKVVYMVPTKAFQIHHYSQREFIHQILKGCDDPEKAFGNWMLRDHQFGQEILRQAEARNYRTIVVDGSQDIDELYDRVKKQFGLW